MSLRQQLADGLRAERTRPDFWLNCLLFGLLGISIWPITGWVAESAQSQSRLLHALLVIGFASALLVMYGRVQIHAPFKLNRPARNFLIATYALLASSVLLTRIAGISETGSALRLVGSLLSLPAYSCALAAGVLFIFGSDPGVKRITFTVTGTLCAFLILSTLAAPLDWPLRTLAGEWSGAALGILGKEVELGLAQTPAEAPKLILLVGEIPFHVASECNGFGVILTSLLLALLLALYRKLGPFDFLLNLVAGLVLGFIFNTLRIVIIVLLAPFLMQHYMLMHEIVGGLTYWACLILVWLLLNGPVRDEPADS